MKYPTHPAVNEQTGFLLRKVSAASFARFAAIVGEHGLHPMHFGMLMILEAEEPISQQELSRRTGIDPSTMVALVDELERAGFDRRVTAAGVADLLGLLARLTPTLAEATFVRAWAGLRPGTPDHLPILGPAPDLDSVSLATGHYRNGILLAPITGELIAQSVLGQPTTLPLAPFSVARFGAEPAAVSSQPSADRGLATPVLKAES